MTSQERNVRRALLVRRWAAYRVGRAQREIWKKRRAAQVDDEVVGQDDFLAELPDVLLG